MGAEIDAILCPSVVFNPSAPQWRLTEPFAFPKYCDSPRGHPFPLLVEMTAQRKALQLNVALEGRCGPFWCGGGETPVHLWVFWVSPFVSLRMQPNPITRAVHAFPYLRSSRLASARDTRTERKRLCALGRHSPHAKWQSAMSPLHTPRCRWALHTCAHVLSNKASGSLRGVLLCGHLRSAGRWQ